MTPDNTEHTHTDWPEAKQFRSSIRLEFAIYVSIIIILLMAATGYVITDKFVESTTQNVVEKLLIQARSYSGPAGKHIISANGPDALMLNNICKKLNEDNPDVMWTGIADNERVFLAHSDISQVITKQKMSELYQTAYEDLLNAGEFFALNKDTLLLIMPIRENKINLGYLGIASSDRRINEARTSSIISVVSISLIMIAIGLPLTVIIVNRKLKPISVITDNLKAVDYKDIDINIPITTANEFGYLADTLQVMGKRLHTAQKDLIEKERIEREFEIAREIQEKILPRSFPSDTRYEFSGYYASAKEVGGDYYDFIELDDGCIGFLVADVSGKSLPGMLVMLLTRDIVKQYARKLAEPHLLLSKINDELSGNIKRGMFVTMFYGVLNTRTGQFSFASAGHNPLLYYNSRKNEIEQIKTKGFPLGMMGDEQFSNRIETGTLKLLEKDWLIQYTDGINEAQNSENEEFGMERFIDLSMNVENRRPEELIDYVITGLGDFVGDAEQYDDITLLAMRWSGSIEHQNKSSAGVLSSEI